MRLAEVAIEGDDARDDGLPARGQYAHDVAWAHASTEQAPAVATEVEVRAIDPLHGHAQRPLAARGDLDVFEVREQGRPRVPGRVRARLGEIVAMQRRQRDRHDAFDVELRGEFAVLVLDRCEGLSRPADEVELVHRQHDVADAEQGHQVAVPARLRKDALACIDEDHREVGGGGTGDHVARVLFVARRVGDDELAALGRKEAVGDIDRDALLAFGAEAVEQQREIKRVALGAEAPRIAFECRELVVEQRLRLVQHAPDQGALAVVDAATGDEAQQALALLRVEPGADVVGRIRCGHQK